MIPSPSRDPPAGPGPETIATLRGLLTQNHVERALLCDVGEHNCVPHGLSTIAHLNGTPEQLESFYNAKKNSIPSWSLSPGRINTFEHRQRFLGDVRFQRAYMDYFSLQLLLKNHNIQALMSSELFRGDRPLVLGLFGGLGQPLILLGDAIELQNPILITASLVLAAVDWSHPLNDLLRDPQLSSGPSSPSQSATTPDAILAKMAYDGRFSGIMKCGTGFKHVNLVLSNQAARAAVVEYAQLLDLRRPADQLRQLGALAVRLLCGTHKKGHPAFDIHLAQLVTLVHSATALLQTLDGALLVRGVWVLTLLTYISQLRPVLDASLASDVDLPGDEEPSWDNLFSEFRGRRDAVRGKYLDAPFLRTLRSLEQLGRQAGANEALYLAAAWKLRLQWVNWIGTGARGEDTLNIRL